MKKLSASLSVLLLAISFAALPLSTVYARNSGESGSSSSHNSETENENEAEVENHNESSDDNLTEAEKKALEQQKEIEKKQAEVEKHKSEKEREARKKVEERAKEIEDESDEKPKKNDDERKKTCEDRKKGLESKLANLVKNGTKLQAKIDGYYGRAVTYVNENNLTDSDLAAKINTATDAKAKAAASVAALSELSPTLDCSSQTVAGDVAKFKAAAEQARNDLKTYKQSVKAVLEAIETLQEKGDS